MPLSRANLQTTLEQSNLFKQMTTADSSLLTPGGPGGSTCWALQQQRPPSTLTGTLACRHVCQLGPDKSMQLRYYTTLMTLSTCVCLAEESIKWQAQPKVPKHVRP